VLEDPFIGDDVGANSTRDKIPSIRASYSSSMARCQDRSAWTEVGTRESGGDEVADSVSLSIGSRKPRFAPCGH
jgi:hypothetical protein